MQRGDEGFCDNIFGYDDRKELSSKSVMVKQVKRDLSFQKKNCTNIKAKIIFLELYH